MTGLRITYDGVTYSFDPGTTVTIGRSLDNSVVVGDPTVSRQHAYLIFGPGGWVLEDIGTDRVFLSGRPVKRTTIAGSVELRLVTASGPSLRFDASVPMAAVAPPPVAPPPVAPPPVEPPPMAPPPVAFPPMTPAADAPSPVAASPSGPPPPPAPPLPMPSVLPDAASSPAPSPPPVIPPSPLSPVTPPPMTPTPEAVPAAAMAPPPPAMPPSPVLPPSPVTPPTPTMQSPQVENPTPTMQQPPVEMPAAPMQYPQAGVPTPAMQYPPAGMATPGAQYPQAGMATPGVQYPQPGVPAAPMQYPQAGVPTPAMQFPQAGTPMPGMQYPQAGVAPGMQPPPVLPYVPPGKKHKAAKSGHIEPHAADLATAIHILVPIKTWVTDPAWRRGFRLLIIAYGLLPTIFLVLFQNSTNPTTPGWAYSLYIAPLWAIAFWNLIRPGPITKQVMGVAAGVVVGVLVLIQILTLPWEKTLDKTHNVHSLLPWIYGVGYAEEVTKALPILIAALILLRFRKVKLDVRMWMFLGTIAGLTFGVAESAQYVGHFLTLGNNNKGIEIPVILLFAVRVFLDGFQHAVWAGISGFFIGMGINYRRRRWPLIVAGVSIPAILHGLNDWSTSLSNQWAWIGVGAVSLVLFLGYAGSAASIESHVRETPLFRGDSMLMSSPFAKPASRDPN